MCAIHFFSKLSIIRCWWQAISILCKGHWSGRHLRFWQNLMESRILFHLDIYMCKFEAYKTRQKSVLDLLVCIYHFDESVFLIACNTACFTTCALILSSLWLCIIIFNKNHMRGEFGLIIYILFTNIVNNIIIN